MPTGVEEAVLVETAKETAREVATEVVTEATEVLETDKITHLEKTGLTEHKVGVEDVDNIFDDLKKREIKSITKASEELGDRLSRTELERRGNIILEPQPPYKINDQTGYPYRADYRIRMEPGSSFREVVKSGDKFSVTEKITSVRKEALLDVKNHSVESLNRCLPDTLEKINRMKEVSPNTHTIISIPEDVALDSRAIASVSKMKEEGARVITHAPYEASMREAIRRYFEIKSKK